MRTLALLFVTLLSGPALAAPADGWLLFALELRSMDGRGNLFDGTEGLSDFSIARVDDGKRTTIRASGPRAHLITLAPGTYCLNHFSTGLELRAKYCKPPYLEVRAGEVTNAGLWTFGIIAGNGRINYRLADSYAIQYDIAALALGKRTDEAAAIRAAIGLDKPSSDITGTVWYSRDHYGSLSTFTFRPDGRVVERLLEVNAAEDDGWLWQRVGDRIEVKHTDGFASFNFVPHPTRLDGEGVNQEGTRWRWVASRDPFDELLLNRGSEAAVVLWKPVVFPPDVPAGIDSGSVTLRFQSPATTRSRIGYRLTNRAQAIEVVSASHPGVFDAAARSALESWLVAPPWREGEPVDGSGEVTIRFQR